MKKPDYITFRTTPRVKAALEELASEGFRSLSQECEMVIVQWLLEKKHITKQDLDKDRA
jgi:hypothetical protein